MNQNYGFYIYGFFAVVILVTGEGTYTKFKAMCLAFVAKRVVDFGNGSDFAGGTVRIPAGQKFQTCFVFFSVMFIPSSGEDR